MADKDREKRIAAGMTALLTQLEMNGVAVAAVDDGHVYAFSKKKLLELIEACDRSKEEKVIVFVKHGPEAKASEGN